MNKDDTPQPAGPSPMQPSGESSLDDLLDSVRDHLHDTPVIDEDIPLLTEVVVAAKADASVAVDIEQLTDDDGLYAPVERITSEADQPGVSHAWEEDDDDSDTEDFDVTQVATGYDDLMPIPAVAVDGVEQSQTQFEQPWVDQSLEPPAQTGPATTLVNEAPWEDDADEQFDATQVASFEDLNGDEISGANRPIISTDRSDQLPPVPDVSAEAADLTTQQLSDQEVASELEQKLTTGGEEKPLTPAGEDGRGEGAHPVPAYLLDQLDQIIESRCEALADELKQQLRETLLLPERDAS